MDKAFLPVLIVENGPNRGEPLQRMVTAAGFAVRVSSPYRGGKLPQPQAASVVILSGGPASLCAPQQSDGLFLYPVLQFTRAAIAYGTPVIGICLGHQIIARALNGKVVRHPAREVGIRRIHPTSSQLSKDPESNDIDAFVFHQDHVAEAPPDCVITFRSEHCAVEGFRHRERPIHGLQFHPEIGCQQAKSILNWWYKECGLNPCGSTDGLTFDETPVQHLLLSLIGHYAVRARA